MLHVGAFIGTIMAVNVFAIIVPNQKKIVAQLIVAKRPKRATARSASSGSTHNNYLTLPVLLMMVSPHYPFLSTHPQAWLIVDADHPDRGVDEALFHRADAATTSTNIAGRVHRAFPRVGRDLHDRPGKAVDHTRATSATGRSLRSRKSTA